MSLVNSLNDKESIAEPWETPAIRVITLQLTRSLLLIMKIHIEKKLKNYYQSFVVFATENNLSHFNSKMS